MALHWNYLRVRGEYKPPMMGMLLMLELPPRARRIRVPWGEMMAEEGTTSACAENTHHADSSDNFYKNYLRVRGEYPK